jgi:hypothetical protein
MIAAKPTIAEFLRHAEYEISIKKDASYQLVKAVGNCQHSKVCIYGPVLILRIAGSIRRSVLAQAPTGAQRSRSSLC